jgi:hypothetical protein
VMALDELGMDMDRAREVIGAADLDKAREYALALLDDLRVARAELVRRASISPFVGREHAARVRLDLPEPVTLWGQAVAALRKLAEKPRILAVDNAVDESAVLDRAADWLAAIGPDTTKLPCEVCLKPTSIGCARCDRSLCQTHAARNTRDGSHDGGRLACVW